MATALDICLAEVRQAQERAAHYGLRISTGVYKTREAYIGGYDNSRRMTEAELLESEIQTQERHIERAERLLDRAKALLRE